jgi:hypothetical protein
MTERTTPERLEDLPCCERPRLRTVYRGPLGCVEECEGCGFAYGWDADGNLTELTLESLRAQASALREPGEAKDG